MADRDELIEAGVRAIVKQRPLTNAEAMDAILDAVEPIIRADERAASTIRELTAEIRALTRLRAQVNALPRDISAEWVRLDHIRALFDGGN